MIKNRKGFTMVELLAVIVIIGILSTIGVVATTRYLKKSRQKSYLQMSESIYQATKNCILEENCSKPTKTSVVQYETGYLIDNGYIDKLRNPNKSNDDCTGVVTIMNVGTSDNGKDDYIYSVGLQCSKLADVTLMWPEKEKENSNLDEIFNEKNNINSSSSTSSSSNNTNITKVYNNGCLAGSESGCKEINVNSTYPTGSLVKYKVNDKEVKNFYVLYDYGTKLKLIQSENTINSPWTTSGSIDSGPDTLIQKLNAATINWTNVPYQTYEMGKTQFAAPNNTYTATNCLSQSHTNWYISCGFNTYQWNKITTRARAITGEELQVLGCRGNTVNSCPEWLGGSYFWTMSSMLNSSNDRTVAMLVNNRTVGSYPIGVSFGARAVIEVNKNNL